MRVMTLLARVQTKERLESVDSYGQFRIYEHAVKAQQFICQNFFSESEWVNTLLSGFSLWMRHCTTRSNNAPPAPLNERSLTQNY